jgi:hypothetical protein
MKKIVIYIMVVIGFTSCTQNEIARNYGGSETIKLPVGEKLVNITWKEEHLWVLTTDMKSDDSAHIYNFKEKSSWGVMEGNITIVEIKPRFQMTIN